MPKSCIIIITRVGFHRNCYLPELCAVNSLDVALEVRAAVTKIKLFFLQKVVSSFRPACLTLQHLVHEKYWFILKSACLTQMVLSCHHPVTEWNINPVFRRETGTLLKLNTSQQAKFLSGPGAEQRFRLSQSVPCSLGHHLAVRAYGFLTEATKLKLWWRPRWWQF